MPDQVTMAIVTALAGKAAELAADGVKGAGATLVRLIRRRLGAGTADAGALDSALARPEDRAALTRAAAVLARVMASDPDFAAQVRAGWRAAAPELAADRGSVVNQFSGRAGTVLQARDIGGDVRFGG